MATWQRRRTYSNDTTAGLSVMLNGVDNVQAFLDSVAGDVGMLADNVTSKVAKTARKTVSQIDASKFTMGGANIKYDKTKGWIAGGSKWDSALGGYVSRRGHHNGRGLRMINFQYKHLAGNYGKKMAVANALGYSEVGMTSQVANLWENDAYYTKNSARWLTAKGEEAFWTRGTRRPGKHYFNMAFSNAINSAVPVAKQEAIDKFNADVKKAEAKFNRAVRRAAGRMGGTP